MNGTSWKEIMLGTLAGLSILTSPAMGSVGSTTEESAVQTDNRGTGFLNSEPNEGNHRGRDGRGRLVIAQASDDIRQEERRADRREDRRVDRREDRREERREDRRLERREDRQVDRREDHRSNAGGELRGLDRADQVAGEHGRDGRDNARMMQMDRPHRPERMERIERPERQEHPDRPERPERSGRN